MTKSTVAQGLLAALLALCLLAPAALAHGVLAPRETDLRVLVDDDGAVAPGGCSPDAEQACDSPGNLGGLDLLTLDLRETHLANGTPVVDFRVGFQGGKEGVAQTVAITFTAGGEARTFDFAGPTGGPYNSTTCDLFAGPIDFPGGDGHVKAVDCFVSYAALGANATGGSLTEIRLLSSAAGKKYDAVPGTWYTDQAQDRLTPRIPTCDAEETPPCQAPTADDPTGGDLTPGTYALAGPATLVEAALSMDAVDMRGGPKKVNVTLQGMLANTTQIVTLEMTAPATVSASLDKSTVFVGNGTQTVALNIVSASRDGVVTIVMTSDLGAYEVLTLAVTAPPPAPTCPGGAAPTGSGTAASCPTDSETQSETSPGPELVSGTALLVGLAFLRRRA